MYGLVLARRRNSLRLLLKACVSFLVAWLVAGSAAGAGADGSKIDWTKDFKRARILGIRDDKLVVAYVMGKECPGCRVMEEQVFTSPVVEKALEPTIPVWVEYEPGSVFVKDYKIVFTPTVIILSGGDPVVKFDGVVRPEEFAEVVRAAKGLAAEYAKAEAEAAAHPDDPTLEAKALVLRVRNGVGEWVESQILNCMKKLADSNEPKAQIARIELSSELASEALDEQVYQLAAYAANDGLDAVARLKPEELDKVDWRQVEHLFRVAMAVDAQARRQAMVRKRARECEEFLEARLKKDPDDVELARRLAWIYSIDDKSGEAAKTLAAAWAKGPDKFRDPDGALVELAGYEDAAGDKEAALKHLGALIESYPKSPYVLSAYYGGVRILMELERPDEARKWYEALVKKAPQSDEAKGAARLLEGGKAGETPESETREGA